MISTGNVSKHVPPGFGAVFGLFSEFFFSGADFFGKRANFFSVKNC